MPPDQPLAVITRVLQKHIGQQLRVVLHPDSIFKPYICGHTKHNLKKLIFTVTNDLSYDQRMQRICTSLSRAGYTVKLVGRKMNCSIPLIAYPFKQKRLKAWFTKGKLMYLEYNLRLFWYLLFQKFDVICAIDLDTILPCYFVSILRKKHRLYDAHELFTEQKEIVTRPSIYKMWLAVERFAVPKFKLGYTVNQFIADEFKRRYGVNYGIVKNMPTLKSLPHFSVSNPPIIIYQGAVNEGRSFETLIPAMKNVPAKLVICGKGNFYDQAQKLIADHGLESKVELRGYVLPQELATLTPTAYAAVMLFENTGLNQYHSLANRFFDYIMAGIPQVCVAYPEYKSINDTYGVALLINDTREETIANALNNLLSDTVLYNSIKENCLKTRTHLNWESEEKILVNFYETHFS